MCLGFLSLLQQCTLELYKGILIRGHDESRSKCSLKRVGNGFILTKV